MSCAQLINYSQRLRRLTAGSLNNLELPHQFVCIEEYEWTCICNQIGNAPWGSG